jgi:2-dehydro-3-deoxyglucarate aldolase/4-hydroxy-2-oxoheptanedioate aldolase
MRPNKVKRALRQGGVSIGTMSFEFCTDGLARLAAGAGAEFVIFDMEHTGWSVETIRALIAASRSADLASFVRVPATQYHFIARVLDMGAQGIMVPMVQDQEQAQLIVQSAKYPPVGQRGAAFGVAHDDFSDGDVVAKMRSADEELLLIAQIESPRAVDNAERIASVEGIDVLWIGQFDLSNFSGIPGQFDHPLFRRSVERVVEAARRHHKAAGYMVGSVEEGSRLLKQGFRCLAYWGDLWLYKQALRQGIEGLRASVWQRG